MTVMGASSCFLLAFQRLHRIGKDCFDAVETCCENCDGHCNGARKGENRPSDMDALTCPFSFLHFLIHGNSISDVVMQM